MSPATLPRDEALRELLDGRPRYEEVEAALPDPGYRRWAIWRSAARFLGNVAVTTGRRNVLEFGSGSSSRVLARALRRNGGGRLTALENLPEYSAETWREVEAVPSVDARLVPAPLRLTVDAGGVRYRYDVPASLYRERGPFDLVFVDAPPFFCGRDGTLPEVVPFLAEGALVVLDDTRRRAEQRMVERWVTAFPGLRAVLMEPGFGGEEGHGVGVLAFDGDRRRRGGVGAFLGTTLAWLGTFRHPRWKLRLLAGRLGA